MVQVKGSFRLESQRFRIERTGSEKNSISCPLSTCSALLASLAMPIRRAAGSGAYRGREDMVRRLFAFDFTTETRRHGENLAIVWLEYFCNLESGVDFQLPNYEITQFPLLTRC